MCNMLFQMAGGDHLGGDERLDKRGELGFGAVHCLKIRSVRRHLQIRGQEKLPRWRRRRENSMPRPCKENVLSKRVWSKYWLGNLGDIHDLDKRCLGAEMEMKGRMQQFQEEMGGEEIETTNKSNFFQSFTEKGSSKIRWWLWREMWSQGCSLFKMRGCLFKLDCL